MKQLFFMLCSLFFVQACSIKLINTSVPENIKTFSVEQFETKAPIAPPTAGQQFSEQFKQKVLNNTRLSLQPSKGDLQFSGAITSYEVKFVAPTPNQTVSSQQLSIQVQVNCKNLKATDEKDREWTQSFSRFAPFPANADLAAVQDQLINEIYNQLIEDAFNRAFTGW
jgi:hypothetical protein